MFHMKNPTQIWKAKATTIIQIEKPMFHVNIGFVCTRIKIL